MSVKGEENLCFISKITVELVWQKWYRYTKIPYFQWELLSGIIYFEIAEIIYLVFKMCNCTTMSIENVFCATKLTLRIEYVILITI